jgi:hypothetical protein
VLGRKTPLHLKLVMYHEERKRQGRAMDIRLSYVKTVLMPRQYGLKALDPIGTATAEELLAKIVPLANIYHAVVLKDLLPADMGVEEALGIYRNFHMLLYTQEWSENDIPVACSCKTCHCHCICTQLLPYSAVFEPRIRVPPEYIAKTVAERKCCKSAKSAAGRKRLKFLTELADDEKKTDSKVKYLKGTMPPPAAAAGATVHKAPLLCAMLHPSKVHISSPASMVASAGETDLDLAGRQFLRNCLPYNIIEFKQFKTISCFIMFYSIKL